MVFVKVPVQTYEHKPSKKYHKKRTNYSSIGTFSLLILGHVNTVKHTFFRVISCWYLTSFLFRLLAGHFYPPTHDVLKEKNQNFDKNPLSHSANNRNWHLLRFHFRFHKFKSFNVITWSGFVKLLPPCLISYGKSVKIYKMKKKTDMKK